MVPTCETGDETQNSTQPGSIVIESIAWWR
jgi:hypothetical protein